MDRESGDAEWLAVAKLELKDLLTWSNELPEEFTLGNPAYGRHKFRGNWFQGAISTIKVIASSCADVELLKSANDFAKRRRQKDPNAKTTREEIDEVDQLIRRALEKL